MTEVPGTLGNTVNPISGRKTGHSVKTSAVHSVEEQLHMKYTTFHHLHNHLPTPWKAVIHLIQYRGLVKLQAMGCTSTPDKDYVEGHRTCISKQTNFTMLWEVGYKTFPHVTHLQGKPHTHSYNTIIEPLHVQGHPHKDPSRGKPTATDTHFTKGTKELVNLT